VTAQKGRSVIEKARANPGFFFDLIDPIDLIDLVANGVNSVNKVLFRF
jgi:hypothetical protein